MIIRCGWVASVVGACLLSGLVACIPEKAGSSVILPLIGPPVRAATPPALGGTASSSAPLTLRQPLDSNDVKTRFFTSGPTNVFRILDDIDSRLTDVNAQLAGTTGGCSSQDPVAFNLNVLGENVPFFAQCFVRIGSDFLQFAQKDEVTYLFSTVGAGPLAARIEPVQGAANQYTVRAWIGIADGATSGGSYGLITLQAHSGTRTLEMAVAGLGFGYCGAQLKSSATQIYFTGSPDMGSSCEPNTNACVAANDISTLQTCEPAVTQFAITPLGRLAAGTSAASQYPGAPGNQVNVEKTATDSVHFGPTSPTSGAQELTKGSK